MTAEREKDEAKFDGEQEQFQSEEFPTDEAVVYSMLHAALSKCMVKNLGTWKHEF